MSVNASHHLRAVPAQSQQARRIASYSSRALLILTGTASDPMYKCMLVHHERKCFGPAGFRKIGFNPLIALAAVPVIHGSLSYPTQPGFIPDMWFSINTNNIHKCVPVPFHQ
jgi:Caleosin related protein